MHANDIRGITIKTSHDTQDHIKDSPLASYMSQKINIFNEFICKESTVQSTLNY